MLRQGEHSSISACQRTIGNAGRGIFRGSGFKTGMFSVVKDEKFKERLTAQFRAEFFNVLNHPNFYNPTGPAGAGFNDPTASGTFGCGCNTPDQASPIRSLGRRKPFDPVGLETDLVTAAGFFRKRGRFKIGPSPIFSDTLLIFGK